ncbi:DUF6303 family protein [Kitasatospora sp. NPDC018058]|uniref:DUF6303 family protein n=1 Tax=Kitasatospora sp. NPDC018058 TaxID=3364025 RepID=UPI0037C12230
MTEPTTYRAQITLRPGVGWVLFVMVPGRVADWPTQDFLTIDGRPPTIADRSRALESLGYRLADPAAAWEWVETQDGAECAPQTGDAPVNLSAAVTVVATDAP